MRRAFTILELCIVMGIITILLAILLPAVERVRHRGYIDACASNLRAIGQAMTMYANENRGNYPRTTYVPGAPIALGTGAVAADPFQPGGPAANDVSAEAYLLMRAERMMPVVFTCPYDDVFHYLPETGDWQNRSNFTSIAINLGYSSCRWLSRCGIQRCRLSVDDTFGRDLRHCCRQESRYRRPTR